MLVKDAMHPRAVTANPHESVVDAAVKMQMLNVKRLPVLHDGQLVGLLTDGEVRRKLPALHEGLTPWEFAVRAGSVRVRDAMLHPVLTAAPGEPLAQAIRVMLARRVGGLPVVGEEDGQLLGMLTLTDVLRAVAREPRLSWGTVRQHMTETTVSTPAEAPASEAAAKLRVSGLKVLPVLEGDRLVGVLHERDLAERVERAKAGHGDTLLGDQFFLEGQAARDLMRLPGGYVLDHAPLHSAVTRMLEADVHGLPVISEGGRLLGVVTISDVLRGLLGEHGEHEPDHA
ncbi:CBS domain-containing protein [Deinococcus budaensis]|uniref:CBS domain-containing protein n=1 Tax=Deinococcus budaensis TaxID=1665626 RepID=A0A7W8GEX4_9DEIO|nr:CBS domain-containing protein [Deinococcus budaensis]MBB5233986.1 CBS domain-containing protein [Deinococcus budaensis]